MKFLFVFVTFGLMPLAIHKVDAALVKETLELDELSSFSLPEVQNLLKSLQDSIHGLNAAKAEQDRVIHELQSKVSQNEDEIKELHRIIQHDRIKVNTLENKLNEEHELRKYQQKSLNLKVEELEKLTVSNGEFTQIQQNNNSKLKIIQEIKSQHAGMGCLSEYITLSCPNERLITVTTAHYGQHNYTCTKSCCPPNPLFDCVESVAENNPSDFASLKYQCDNRTTCTYQYSGAIIDQCKTGYSTDYMQIFYSCLPEDINGAVGFTAYSSVDPRTYYANEVVLFDLIISNFGGHYSPESCAFVCPYDGVYVFSVCFRAEFAHGMGVDIYIDSKYVIHQVADIDSGSHSAASAIVVAECKVGQVVWARAQYNESALDGTRRSHFTGFLLHKTIEN